MRNNTKRKKWKFQNNKESKTLKKNYKMKNAFGELNK